MCENFKTDLHIALQTFSHVLLFLDCGAKWDYSLDKIISISFTFLFWVKLTTELHSLLVIMVLQPTQQMCNYQNLLQEYLEFCMGT